MPVYPLSRGKWLVRVHHKGKPYTRTINGTKKDALAFEASFRVELATSSGVAAPRVVPKFSTFCLDRYKPHAELTLSANWWRKQRSMLGHLIEYFGDDRLSEIDTVRVDAYQKKRLRDGVKPVTVNNEVRVLTRILNYALEMKLRIPKPKFRKLKERVKFRRPKAWTDAEIGKLLKAVKAECPNLMPLVVFLLNTGCRKGEALALTWDNVDLKQQMIRIWPSDEWVPADERWQPKDGEPREIPISSALLPWLKWVKDNPPGPKVSATRIASAWVFPSRNGTRYAVWPQNQFDRARDAAGLQGGPHRLRHTYATKFLQTTPDLFLLARILGHDDTSVTKNYSHLLPSHLARARDAVSISASLHPR